MNKGTFIVGVIAIIAATVLSLAAVFAFTQIKTSEMEMRNAEQQSRNGTEEQAAKGVLDFIQGIVKEVTP